MGRLFIATERVIVGALVVMMTLIIVLATMNLGLTIGRSLVTPPLLLPEVHELLDTFNAFLVVLIGVELLDTVRGYLSEHVVRVELVLDVALIAVARKVIVLKLKADGTLIVFGIAALVIALAGARFRARGSRSRMHSTRPSLSRWSSAIRSSIREPIRPRDATSAGPWVGPVHAMLQVPHQGCARGS